MTAEQRHREPACAALAYTPDSQWRNRSRFISGRTEIIAFLTEKWAELEYRLIKEVWAHQNNRIAVRFSWPRRLRPVKPSLGVHV